MRERSGLERPHKILTPLILSYNNVHFIQMKVLLLRLWHIGPTSLLNKNLPQPLQRLLNVFLRKQAKRSAHIGRFLPAGKEHSSRQCEYTMLISLCLDDRLRIASVWKEEFEPRRNVQMCKDRQRVDPRRTKRTAQTQGNSIRPVQKDVSSWRLRIYLFSPYKTQRRPRNAP